MDSTTVMTAGGGLVMAILAVLARWWISSRAPAFSKLSAAISAAVHHLPVDDAVKLQIVTDIQSLLASKLRPADVGTIVREELKKLLEQPGKAAPPSAPTSPGSS